MAGAPIALQFAGQRFSDTQLLADVVMIDQVLRA